MIVSGNPTTKDLKSCFSEVMSQLGPKQKEALKKLGATIPEKAEAAKPKVDFQQVSEKN